MVGQVAGVVVGGGGGRIQAEGRQGGHAQVFGRVVGPEAAQVIFCDRAGRHHVVNRPLQAGGWDGERCMVTFSENHPSLLGVRPGLGHSHALVVDAHRQPQPQSLLARSAPPDSLQPGHRTSRCMAMSKDAGLGFTQHNAG